MCAMGALGDDYDEADSDAEEVAQSKPFVGHAAPSPEGASAATETVRIHSLSGATEAVPSSAISEAVKSQTRNDRKSVMVTYMLRASLNELADGTVAPELKLPEGAKDFFDTGRDAASKHHVLYGAKIMAVKNGFPVAFTVDVADDSNFSVCTKCVTDAGAGRTSTGAHLIAANETSSFGARGMDILRGYGANIDKQKFAQQYPGYNLDNIDSGVQYVSDAAGEQALVRYGHPVAMYFDAILRAQGAVPLTEKDLVKGSRSYIGDANDIKKCMVKLREQLQKNTINLYDMKFDISRAFGDFEPGASKPSFDEWSEVRMSCASDATARAILDQKKILTFSVMYDFRPS